MGGWQGGGKAGWGMDEWVEGRKRGRKKGKVVKQESQNIAESQCGLSGYSLWVTSLCVWSVLWYSVGG